MKPVKTLLNHLNQIPPKETTKGDIVDSLLKDIKATRSFKKTDKRIKAAYRWLSIKTKTPIEQLRQSNLDKVIGQTIKREQLHLVLNPLEAVQFVFNRDIEPLRFVRMNLNEYNSSNNVISSRKDGISRKLTSLLKRNTQNVPRGTNEGLK